MPKIDARAFLVKPGSEVRLRHWRTDEDGGMDKPAGEALLAERLSRLDALQMRFWANRSRAMRQASGPGLPTATTSTPAAYST